MSEISIPNTSPIGWEPGIDVGIVSGLGQYRPGGASQRIILHNVVDDWGVDNVGTNEVQTIITSNLSSVGTNEVVYFPYGVFKVTESINSNLLTGSQGTKSNFTYRGAGMGIKSQTSLTMGTGTKTISVPAGLGWTTGIGCRIWAHNAPHKWMQGIVNSYTGTELTLNITTKTSGNTETLSLWTVGQTVIIRETNNPVFVWNPSAPAGDVDILGSPSIGSTSITVSDGSGLTISGIANISSLSAPNGEDYGVYPRRRDIINRISNVVGNTVTLSEPLLFDYPSTLSPKISSAYFNYSNCGIEDMAMFGRVGDSGPFIAYWGSYNCWIYKVFIGCVDRYGISVLRALRCEVAYVVAGGNTNGTNSEGPTFETQGAVQCLWRHNVTYWGTVFGENYYDFNNAYLFNFSVRSQWNINHGVSHYSLFEGNIVPGYQVDGYFGGSKKFTLFKNWVTGSPQADPTALGTIRLDRFGRYHNVVGNVLGRDGITSGIIDYGWPNIGNKSTNGTANSVLHTQTTGISGSLMVHLDAGGFPRLSGTLTSRTGLETVVTLTTNTLGDLIDPKIYANARNYFYLIWGTGNLTTVRGYNTLVSGLSSGNVIVFEDYPFSGTTQLPSNGTPISIYPFAEGMQERDEAVYYTSFNAQNYLCFGANGTGSVQCPLSEGDYLPNSLAYSSTPSDWPSNFTWPIDINANNPSFRTDISPAGYYYNNAEWPDSNQGSSFLSRSQMVSKRIILLGRRR